ncbi:MAG: peptide chain release factor N(5)-glutamine methyltransferase [Candidatus Eiseniibacteriota bacterium]
MIGAATTLGELVEAGAGELRRAAGDDARANARRDASLLLGSVLGLDRAAVLSRSERAVTPAEADRYRELVRRRAAGTPLQLLLGESVFHDVTIAVEHGVFIPRPETELLVDEAIAAVERLLDSRGGEVRAVDLCTGAGAVAVAVAWKFRDVPRVRVHAGDTSAAAVELARRNAVAAGVAVDVRRSDLLAAFKDLEGAADVLTANPPYIAPEEMAALPVEVRLGDPADALLDPEGGTGFHRRIAEQGQTFLRPGGLLALEIGWRQGAEAAGILTAAGYEDVAVLPDLAGRDRIVRGRRPSSTPSW